MGQNQISFSASLLAACPLKLGAEAVAALEAGADSLHIDIMDHHYVPNLGLNPWVCRALRQQGIQAPFNVHLMAMPVDALIVSAAQAGASSIVFHPEASQHLDRSLTLIREQGCRSGLAINPGTHLNCLDYVWHQLDQVLLMSVNPGFSGQQFLPVVLKKIHELKQHPCYAKHKPEIVIDGGINLDSAGACIHAGADTLVVGHYLFASEDYPRALKALGAEKPWV